MSDQTPTNPPSFKVTFFGPDNTQRVLFGTLASSYPDFGRAARLATDRASELGWDGFNIVAIQLCQNDIATF